MLDSINNKNTIPNARTKGFIEINGKGRVQLYGFVLCDETTCLVYNIYGYTGSENSKEAASRTNDIIKLILEDAKHQPKDPMLIVGV